MDEFQSEDNLESKDVIGGARIVRSTDPDTYSDPDSARVRARQLGCIGIRRYSNRNGGVSWMPCTNESDYRKYSGIGYSGRKFRRTQLEREVRRIVGNPSKRKFQEKSANYTNPQLRERIKNRIMAGSRGGAPGQWSARKAQLLALEYRRAGGGYSGKRSKKQRSLVRWTKQRWRTSDGKPAKRGNVTRRYLPAKAWDKLTPGQRAATNRKKIIGSRLGRQFVPNTEAAASARKRATRGTKHINFYDSYETKVDKNRIGGRIGGNLGTQIGRGEVESGGRSARRALGRIGAIVEPFDPHARDADSDLVVQEGTIHERPAVPGVNPIGPAPDSRIAQAAERVKKRRAAIESESEAERTARLEAEKATRDRLREIANISRAESPKPKKRSIRAGAQKPETPKVIQRAPRVSPRREREKLDVRKPINLPKDRKPTNDEILDEFTRPKAPDIRSGPYFGGDDSKPVEYQDFADIAYDRVQEIQNSRLDLTNSLSRPEKSNVWKNWENGRYSIDEIADHFDAVRDEVVSVIKNHQKFRDENLRNFENNNEQLARAINQKFNVSKETVMDAIREGYIKNWDSLLQWVFRNPDSKKKNKNNELESALFRAFPDGNPPKGSDGRYVLGIRPTNRNGKQRYIRDIADRDNQPKAFRQLDEVVRGVESALASSSTRWDTNERAISARMYREMARGQDINKMWDSTITGAMSAGPNMTPQEEAEWKLREWKRQELKKLALSPDSRKTTPTLNKQLKTGDIARDITGLDLIPDDKLDALYDQTVAELTAAGIRPRGYRQQNAPLSPRELASIANIKRPLVKEFLDEYRSIKPDGNIARLDADTMSDKDIADFFDTFIIPGLVNAGNPTVSDVRAAVRETKNADTLSLAEDAAYGIADEYQDLEIRTKIIRQRLIDAGLSEDNPNFDLIVAKLIDDTYQRQTDEALADIYRTLANPPRWMFRNPEEFINDKTGMPYLQEEWENDATDAATRFLEYTEDYLDGKPVDPIAALDAQEELNRQIDIGAANGWISDDIPEATYPEYMNRARRRNTDEDGNPLPPDDDNNEETGMEELPPEDESGDEGDNADEEGLPPDDIIPPPDDNRNEALERLLRDTVAYGHQFGPERAELPPRTEDQYGPLDTDEVWDIPIIDSNGNPIPYDGSDTHPLNLDLNGNPLDVTQNELLPNVLFRHWLANGNFLREWTERNYPGSQVRRYENLDEMTDVAVPPQELEDAMYKGDINSSDPNAIDADFLAGLDRLIDVIAKDNPGWFTRDGKGNLAGDISELIKSGSYGSGGRPYVTFNATDYSAGQLKDRLKEARNEAIKAEQDLLLGSTNESKQRRADLWQRLEVDGLTPEEIAFEENLIDIFTVSQALKKYALENNIADAKYQQLRNIADTTAVQREAAFTQKRIQRIKDDFAAQGLEPKDWAAAIDKEIERQQRIVDNIEIEYSRFRSAFSRRMILVREIFATRPPNRKQRVQKDGTIIPGWDPAKESAARYLNRIRRWDLLHLGTPKKPGPLTELLVGMERSAIEDGRDGAAGATARISQLAQNTITELRNLRAEYSRVKTQADAAGITGFMRTQSRNADLFDNARMNARAAARQAAYGNFTFLEPRVLRRYDKAGLPISRSVRNSAAGFNKRFANEIKDATSGELTSVESSPKYRYLPPKLKAAAKAIESFSNRVQEVSVDMRNGKRRARQMQNAITPDILEAIDAKRAKVRPSRLSLYEPQKLSPNAIPLFGSNISGAMRLHLQEDRFGRWHIVDDFGKKQTVDGWKTKDEARKAVASFIDKPNRFYQIDEPLRKAVEYKINTPNYIGDIVNEKDIAAASQLHIINNREVEKATLGDVVILRKNPTNGKREILLARRNMGPYAWSNAESLALPSTTQLMDEQLRDTPRRFAIDEFNLNPEDIVEQNNLGLVDARDWDPTNPQGAVVSGLHIELNPNTQINLDEPGMNYDWYDIEDIASGKHPLAFGQMVWVSSVFNHEDNDELASKLQTLNALSRRRQQKLISDINHNRKHYLGAGPKKRLMFPKNLPNPDSGFITEGIDADLRTQALIAKIKERFNEQSGPIAGAMGARVLRGPVTQWGSDDLTDDERRKILDDVIELRKKDSNTTYIMHQLNAKWVDDNFVRADGYYHQFNRDQVKDVIYRARIDGVKFPKLYGTSELNPIGPDERAAIATINNMSTAGHSIADIADELDASELEVKRVQRALGLVRIHREKHASNQTAELVRMISAGDTMADAAQKLGLTEKAARKKYNNAISTSSITGLMSTNDSTFAARQALRRDMDAKRIQNRNIFLMRTYGRFNDSDIAKIMGITQDDVADAVNNHLQWIDANETQIVADIRKQLKKHRKRLTPLERQHIQMRLDGLSLDDIATFQQLNEGQARLQEISALAKLNLGDKDVLQKRSTMQDLLDVKEGETELGNGKAYAMLSATGSYISNPDSIRNMDAYLKRLYAVEPINAKELRRIVASVINQPKYSPHDGKFPTSIDEMDLPSSRLLAMKHRDAEFIMMRLTGYSFKDIEPYTHSTQDIASLRRNQAMIMNRLNIAGLIGTDEVEPVSKTERQRFGMIIGVQPTAIDPYIGMSHEEEALNAIAFYEPDANRGDATAKMKIEEIIRAQAALATGYKFKQGSSFIIYNGSDFISDDYRTATPFSIRDRLLPGERRGIVGRMSTGGKSSIIQKREERETKIARAVNALDRIRIESPEKYKALKNSAIAFYNASTGLSMDPDLVIDDIAEIPHSIATRQASGVAIARDSEITKQVKQHALTKRLMAELMVDFAVDGKGNLKGKPSDHVTDEKNIARRDFVGGLNAEAKKLIEDNNLTKIKSRQLAFEPDTDEEKQFQAALRKLVARHMTQDELAASLGVNRWTVQQQLKKMGLETTKRSEKPHPMDERISELLASGMSDRAIGREIGMSRQFVGERKRKLISKKLGQSTNPSKISGEMQSNSITGAMAAMPRRQYSQHDFYSYLDLKPNASAKEIKDAYREIAKKFHPDRNPGDKKAEERFRLAKDAYEVLKDPVEKKYYDRNVLPNLSRTAQRPPTSQPPRQSGQNRTQGGTGFRPQPPPPPKPPLPKLKQVLQQRLGINIPLKDNIIPTGNSLHRYTSNDPKRTVRIPGARGGIINLDEDRFWDVHHKIADAISKAVTKKRKDGEPKRFVIMGGPPASGKSSLRLGGKINIPSPQEAAHIDSDEIKEMIPEARIAHHNNDERWADYVHDESKMIANTALKIAEERNLDIVYDSMGQFIEGLDGLRQAKSNGYEIVSHYVVAPKDVLNSRMDEREKQDARQTPRYIIDAAADILKDVMPKIADLSDEFYLYDGASDKPKLIAQKQKGKELQILDPIAYKYGFFEDVVKDDPNFERPKTNNRTKTVAKNNPDAQMIRDFDSGSTVTELSEKYKRPKRYVFNTVTNYSVDESRSESTDAGYGFTGRPWWRGETRAPWDDYGIDPDDPIIIEQEPFFGANYSRYENTLTPENTPGDPAFSRDSTNKYTQLVPKLSKISPEDFDALRQLAGIEARNLGQKEPDGLKLDNRDVMARQRDLRNRLINDGWLQEDFEKLGLIANEINYIFNRSDSFSLRSTEGFMNEVKDIFRQNGSADISNAALLRLMWKHRLNMDDAASAVYYAEEDYYEGN